MLHYGVGVEHTPLWSRRGDPLLWSRRDLPSYSSRRGDALLCPRRGDALLHGVGGDIPSYSILSRRGDSPPTPWSRRTYPLLLHGVGGEHAPLLLHGVGGHLLSYSME